MKYLKQGTVSLLENDTFRAKGVLYAHDLPKVLWCEQPEAGKEFTIKYNAETGETVADEINYVDLGLPSGLLWATCNVGATKPEEYGLYFLWGDTVGYTGITDDKKFTWRDYKYCQGSQTTITKYNTNADYGKVVDDKTVLDLEDDAAHVHMGGDWRMPTLDELQELYDNTTSEWTTENGKNGRKFTSKTDSSKYIFIPAAGDYEDGAASVIGLCAYVWSSTLYTPRTYYAYNLWFSGPGIGARSSTYRCVGLSVRGVKPKK